MCNDNEHTFTHTHIAHDYRAMETPLGTVCDCGAYYWDGDQAQPMEADEPCCTCYALPSAAGADWCLDCPWLVAWDKAHLTSRAAETAVVAVKTAVTQPQLF